ATAMARPIPELPPVTRATLPWSLKSAVIASLTFFYRPRRRRGPYHLVMKYEVVRNIDRDRLTQLLDAARDHDGHAPLGEHKWLDVVFGKNYITVTAEEDGDLTG